MLLKGPELGIVMLAGDIILDFVPTNIHALHKLALELVQSFRCLSEAKMALDFLNTSDANCRALKTVTCSGTWGPGWTGVSRGNQPIVVPLACDYRVL